MMFEAGSDDLVKAFKKNDLKSKESMGGNTPRSPRKLLHTTAAHDYLPFNDRLHLFGEQCGDIGERPQMEYKLDKE